MEFVKAFNDRTAAQKGTIIPAVITVYTTEHSLCDQKTSGCEMIKKMMKKEKGSGKPGKEIRRNINHGHRLKEIAKAKLEDLNTTNVQMAARIVAGTARSMVLKLNKIKLWEKLK